MSVMSWNVGLLVELSEPIHSLQLGQIPQGVKALCIEFHQSKHMLTRHNSSDEMHMSD